MAAGQTASNAAETTGSEPEDAATVIVDLGKHRRKRIRKLRKGRGRLFDDVQGAVEDLKSEGTIDADAQTVVVIVRQKRRRTRFFY